MYKTKIVLTVLLLGMSLVACQTKEQKEHEASLAQMKDEGLNIRIHGDTTSIAQHIALLEVGENLTQIDKGKTYKNSYESQQNRKTIASFDEELSTLKDNYKKGQLKKQEYADELDRLLKKVKEYSDGEKERKEEYDRTMRNINNMFKNL
jgi:hypothetical protein